MQPVSHGEAAGGRGALEPGPVLGPAGVESQTRELGGGGARGGPGPGLGAGRGHTSGQAQAAEATAQSLSEGCWAAASGLLGLWILRPQAEAWETEITGSGPEGPQRALAPSPAARGGLEPCAPRPWG